MVQETEAQRGLADCLRSVIGNSRESGFEPMQSTMTHICDHHLFCESHCPFLFSTVMQNEEECMSAGFFLLTFDVKYNEQ